MFDSGVLGALCDLIADLASIDTQRFALSSLIEQKFVEMVLASASAVNQEGILMRLPNEE